MINTLKQLEKIAKEKYVNVPKQMNISSHLEFANSNNPLVSIVIAVLNNYNFTLKCLNSIYQFVTGISYEIILIDDGSSDETKNIDKNIKNITIIRNEENQGYIKSCNRAASYAKGKYILLLNNDTQLIDDAITPLVNSMENNIELGAVGPKLIYSDGTIQNAGCRIIDGEVHQIGQFDTPLVPQYNYIDNTIDFLCGACILILSSLWEEVDGYDEIFGLGYCEDVDLSLKVRDAGYEIAYIPESEIIHFKSQSFSGKNTDLIKNNSIKLKEKWGGNAKLSGKRIAWGVGKRFSELYKDSWNIDYIVDNNESLWGKSIKKITVFSPEVLKNERSINLYICTDYYREIINQVINMEVKNINIYIPSMIDAIFAYKTLRIGYALFSEDILLQSYITFYKKRTIKHYIDIGANHPVEGNATILFYMSGANGCLIEANPRYEKLLNALRPRDEILICGCSSSKNDNGFMTYYNVDGYDTRNTFSRDIAKEIEENGYKVTEEHIPVYSLNSIICKYNEVVDYICIDVEGMEYEILRDFSFEKFKVQYFNVEKSEGPIIELFFEKGYRILAETPSNWIFEKKEI